MPAHGGECHMSICDLNILKSCFYWLRFCVSRAIKYIFVREGLKKFLFSGVNIGTLGEVPIMKLSNSKKLKYYVASRQTTEHETKRLNCCVVNTTLVYRAILTIGEREEVLLTKTSSLQKNKSLVNFTLVWGGRIFINYLGKRPFRCLKPTYVHLCI